ncbi:MAG: hypothetical protein WC397_00645 [Candidatus Paceibacterota bacterium]|jgi:hypothetical protein
MNKKLVEYIKSARAAEMTDDQIRQELLGVGWTEKEIEGGIRFSSANFGFRAAIYIFFILLLAGLSAAGFYVSDKHFGWGIISPKAEDHIPVPVQQEQVHIQDQEPQTGGTEDAGGAEIVPAGEEKKVVSEKDVLKQMIACGATATINNASSDADRILCYAEIFKQDYEGGNMCGRLDNLDIGGSGLCNAGMAVAKNDEKMCEEKSGSLSVSSTCKAIIAVENGQGTPKEQLSKCISPSCYSYIFKEKNYDGELCSEIEKEKAGQGACYYGLALGKMDESFCSKVELKNIYSTSKDGFKSLCYYSVAAAKKDQTLCDKAVSQKLFSDNETCYVGVAVSAKDSDLCKKVSDGSLHCYSMVAAAKQDETLCAKEQKGSQSFCYNVVAKAKADESLCAKADAGCYEDLAILKLDENICEKAQDWKNDCYSLLAVLKSDKSICEKTGAYKTVCEKGLEQ